MDISTVIVSILKKKIFFLLFFSGWRDAVLRQSARPARRADTGRCATVRRRCLHLPALLWFGAVGQLRHHDLPDPRSGHPSRLPARWRRDRLRHLLVLSMSAAPNLPRPSASVPLPPYTHCDSKLRDTGHLECRLCAWTPDEGLADPLGGAIGPRLGNAVLIDVLVSPSSALFTFQSSLRVRLKFRSCAIRRAGLALWLLVSFCWSWTMNWIKSRVASLLFVFCYFNPWQLFNSTQVRCGPKRGFQMIVFNHCRELNLVALSLDSPVPVFFLSLSLK